MKGFDYIPPGKEVVNGKLVPKRSDPYVVIEQQRQRIAQLEQKIVNGESAQLQVACDDQRKRIGELEAQITEHLTGIRGRDGTITELSAQVDELTRANADLRVQLEAARRLPDATPDVEALAAANRRIAQLTDELKASDDEVQTLRQTVSELKPTARKRGG